MVGVVEQKPKLSWIEKLSRRLENLIPGRYTIILTIDEKHGEDWTVLPLGKVER